MNSPQAESLRLAAADAGHAPWRQWGPYLSERQWGTVREDYSPHGNAWEYFPHDHARSRAYRWGEDGIAGFSDDHSRLCLSVALWNGQDPILKERLFGLTNNEGNHGEDAKELYYYLDATPTHSWLRLLYKYPQRAFPYAQLIAENQRRGRDQPEFELLDTGAFDDDRYFDVFCDYAKAAADDILLRITAHNRGPVAAPLHVLPQLWFRNTWSWSPDSPRPSLAATSATAVDARHGALGEWRFECESGATLLFCDNETNQRRLFGSDQSPAYPKDAINDAIVHGATSAVNPSRQGTKVAAHHVFEVPAGGSITVRVRLRRVALAPGAEPVSSPDATLHASPASTPAPGAHSCVRPPAIPSAPCGALTPAFADFDAIFAAREKEADAFYAGLQRHVADADARLVQRQAFAGMIWSKQFFYYDVCEWIRGDPAQPPPPEARRHGRNAEWRHLNNADIISMPDKWEYPWYAAWDLAFHCIPLTLVDPEFAKGQLVLLTREWYMHPNGQLPAYEWAFGDVNPPVHAWATWRVFNLDKERRGDAGDIAFLERVFHKLLLNFTWWVNRKDAQGRNIFQGGFLGLDNIGVFDRSAPLPTGGHINQADGTSWMAMYSLNLMRIALELSRHNPVYQDIASKFFEHFLQIAEAMNNLDDGLGLWDEQDEFYYDVLSLPDGTARALRVRSLVGLIPLFAVEVITPAELEAAPEFARTLHWVLSHRPDLARLVSRWAEPGAGDTHLLSLLRGHRMKCLLRRALDEAEFLSPHGIRAISRHHLAAPYVFETSGSHLSVSYEPGESSTGTFGGNSNWRGPIWMPVNYLLVESLRRFHRYYGDDFLVEFPTGSGRRCSLAAIADSLSERLCSLFARGADGTRPVLQYHPKLARDPHFRDLVLFHEYFHGDTGRGVGASHQTGWTGLVAHLIDRIHEPDRHVASTTAVQQGAPAAR